MNAIRTHQRERFSRWGVFRTLAYYALGVAPDKVGVKFLAAYEWPGEVCAPGPVPEATFVTLDSPESWTPLDSERLRTAHGDRIKDLFAAYFHRGDKCVAARWGGVELACIGWVEFTSTYALSPGQRCAVIHNCYTWREYRGRGLYPHLLFYAGNSLQAETAAGLRIFVDCSFVNYASQRGIEKAGFTPAGAIVSAFRRTWRWPRRALKYGQSRDSSVQ